MTRERKINLRVPSDAEKRRALVDFDDLLKDGTREADWQRFFDENPFVLTDTLSSKMIGFYRQVPLITGTPDYVFHGPLCAPGLGDFGVIELKRPDQPLIGVYSTKHLHPSRTLTIAKLEVERHLDAIGRGEFLIGNDFFVAGNRRHAFIIMGESAEVTRKCRSEILFRQFRELLPLGFHLYTYDELFRLFSSTVPPLVQVVVSPVITSALDDVWGELIGEIEEVSHSVLGRYSAIHGYDIDEVCQDVACTLYSLSQKEPRFVELIQKRNERRAFIRKCLHRAARDLMRSRIRQRGKRTDPTSAWFPDRAVERVSVLELHAPECVGRQHSGAQVLHAGYLRKGSHPLQRRVPRR